MQFTQKNTKKKRRRSADLGITFSGKATTSDIAGNGFDLGRKEKIKDSQKCVGLFLDSRKNLSFFVFFIREKETLFLKVIFRPRVLGLNTDRCLEV